MGDNRSRHSSVLVHTGIDVQEAEREFADLSRRLSAPKSDVYSTSTVDGNGSKDLEKGGQNEREGVFDLKEYLSASNDANQAAGLKHKVGCTVCSCDSFPSLNML